MKHYISLGAGVQSSAMALMAAHGEIEPMPEAAIFADTQHEPKEVYAWLEWLKEQLPFPVHEVSKGDLLKDATALKKKKSTGEIYSETMIPFYTTHPVTGERTAILKRQCTSNYKIIPIVKEYRKLAQVKRGEKSIVVTQWLGISTDEMRRMKPAKEKWIENRWPLIERRMNRNSCKEWMQAKGYPEPPRSACTFCPFHNDKEWREMQRTDTASFNAACKAEKELNTAKSQNANWSGDIFFHRSCKPLDKIDFRTDVELGQQLLWEDECEGMCGV